MRTNTRFKLCTLSAAIASTLCTGQQALAQGPMLEEVIVTATRRAESIQDIPINITALSGDFLERERISNLSDIARRVPGMTLVDQGPRNGNALTVRGLSVDSISSPETTLGNSGGDTVGIYMGEIPVYVDWRLNDIDRVEVLIGPQGTLYGAGTLGGAVRYLPNRPQADELTVQVRGDVYDLNEADDLGYETGVTINVPIIEDKLAVRAVIDYEDDPGFIDANYLVREAGVSNPQPDFSNSADVAANLTNKEDVNDDETWAGRLAVRYTGDRVDSTLSYYYQDSEIGGRQINHKNALVSEGFRVDDYESALRFEEPIDRTNELYALETVMDLGFAELTVAAAYSEYEENGSRDQTDLLLDLSEQFYFYYEDFPSFSSFTRDEVDQNRTNFEARLVSQNDGPIGWIVGVFYNEVETDQKDREFTPGVSEYFFDQGFAGAIRPDALEYYFTLDQETTEEAIYAELSYQITDKWQVTGGGRYFRYDDDIKTSVGFPQADTMYGGLPPDEIAVETAQADDDDDDHILKFNTSYYITDDIMTYFTRSEGYRLGGSNGLAPCPDDPLDIQGACGGPGELSFKADTTTNWELGLRSQWGDNLIVNASLFYVEWDDTQIADFTAIGALPITSNAGSATSQGVELAFHWQVLSALSIAGSYAYTEAELDDDVPCLLGEYLDGNGDLDKQACFDDPDNRDVTAYDGDRLPGTPEHQAYLAANYGLMLGDGSELDFTWSATYTSDVLTKIGERASGESLDSYTLHNVAATWLKDSWSVSLYADNVLDEYAETGVRNDTTFTRQVGDFDLRRYYHNVIRPRQVGLRMVYNFGG